jgi:hypothetical protein
MRPGIDHLDVFVHLNGIASLACDELGGIAAAILIPIPSPAAECYG